MRLRASLIAMTAALGFAAFSAGAQILPEAEFSTLIADKVEITDDGKLVASGNVEAMQGDLRLKASRVIYDQDADRLQIEGPIVLRQGDQTIVLADSADLSPDLQDGLMNSARVVMDQQLQLAAAEISRVGGRYTQLYKTVASSCEVCAANPVPLWQIRAERVVHDSVEKQLYFDNAVFEVVGVPVFYLPHMRLPDPTLKRATGFLTPIWRSTDELGFGVKVPYFIRLGDHKDLTVTPYVATSYTRTVELRYRQAFRNGDLEVNAAGSSDDIKPGDLRGYLFAEGDFNLPQDFDLKFHIETTSDDTYLLDYDYSDTDRLDSAIELSRVSRDRLFVAEIIAYRSLRSSEDNETQPYLVGDITWEQRFSPAWLGGNASIVLDAHAHQRRSTEDIDGRDVERISGYADWWHDWVGPWGVLATAGGLVRIDHTDVQNDSRYESSITNVTPYAGAELRWPLIRQGTQAAHVIEPVAQVIWSPGDGDDTPQDESTQLEFDEGNLFSLSRFPADDVQERGLRLNLGVTYTRYDPTGWTVAATLGRIYRQEDLGQFDGYATFDGVRSDWMAAVQFDLPNQVSLINRALFDDDIAFTKNETRLQWDNDFLDLAASYIWMDTSEVESRDVSTNEWNLDADWQINDRWRSAVEWRYDTVSQRSAMARLGLEYRTECATFDFAVRRRFTSSDQIRPSTDYNFAIQLAGFGNPGSGRNRPSRSGCRG